MKYIKIDANTCQICGKKTDWDSSFGRANFIVCPKCYFGLHEVLGLKTLGTIFTLSELRNAQEETK